MSANVPVPELPDPAPPPPPPLVELARPADRERRRAEAYAAACIKGVMTAPAGAVHPALRRAAITVFGMAEHGLIDEPATWADLLAVADALRWPRRRADDLLTWCRAYAADRKPLPEAFR
jgi:hypothetical protein